MKPVMSVAQEIAASTPPPEESSFEQYKSSSRTKINIIGFSDEDSDDESSDESSIVNSSVEIKLLAASVDGLGKRIRKLWKEFMREGKDEQRNQIVPILDELLREDAITRDEYYVS